MYDIKSTTQGMTLIEAVVSISILVTALTGPMVLASQSLKASRDARAELIATHLAEEAIEVVSSMRENNSADDTTSTRDDWMIRPPGQTIINLCDTGEGCVVDVTDHSGGGVWGQDALIKCPAGNCASRSQVYYYPDTGLYRQFKSALASPWVTTPYRRTVRIVGVDNGVNSVRQVRVIATVTYPGYGGNIRTITLNEDLYNWFPKLH